MELDPEARRLIDLTREARTPSARDKLRVDHLLSRSLGLAALATATSAASTAVAKSATVAPALKWTLSLALPALVVAGAASIYQLRTLPGSTSRLEQRAPVVAPAKSPEPAPPASAAEVPSPAAAEAEAAPPELPEAPSTRRAVSGEKRQKGETLNAELDLLHDAQAKWRNRDPNGALALLASHRQQYPMSVLGPEREALRVLCLCAAGRTAEAREVARRSFKNAPRSPLRASVEESCVKP